MNNNNIFFKTILACFICCAMGTSLQAKVIYVNVNNTSGVEDGISWETAYKDLKSSITKAGIGDEVWVAAGTYKSADGSSFNFKNGVKVYGGFNIENARDMSSRNWTENKTILNVNAGNRILMGVKNFTENACFDGFALENSTSTGNGGAAYLYKGHHLANCYINNNKGGANGTINIDGGAGVSEKLIPSLTNCVIKSNSANMGGGVYVYSGGAIIKDCNILENVSKSNYGGGIYIVANASIESTIISANDAANGGGIYVKAPYPTSSVTISKCTITSNTAAIGGGAFFETWAEIVDSKITNNKSSSTGGGLALYGGKVLNCEILSNISTSGTDTLIGTGGGISIPTSTPSSIEIKGCKIGNNSCDRMGGGIFTN